MGFFDSRKRKQNIEEAVVKPEQYIDESEEQEVVVTVRDLATPPI
jgi:hypothetical protein